MDPFDDVISAFDALIECLQEDPRGTPTKAFGGKELIVLRHPGEYVNELHKRCSRVAQMLDYLLRDGFAIKETHTWRRFNGVIRNACGPGDDDAFAPSFTAESLAEALDVIKTARADLIGIHERDPKSGEASLFPPQRPSKATSSSANPSNNGRENVGYGWPTKVALSLSGAAAFYFSYPFLIRMAIPRPEHNITYAVGLIGGTLTCFVLMLALTNTIRKP